jgi:hypothetical protein
VEGTSICDAPVSSITSIALSGSLRSVMYLADSRPPPDGVVGVAHLVELLEIGLQPFEDLDRVVDDGSLTSIFWNRRTRARSFSKNWRYSL